LTALAETIGAAIIEAGYWIAGTSVTAEEAAGSLTLLDYSIAGVSAAQVVGTAALVGISIATAPGAPNPQSQKVNTRNPVQARRGGYGICKIGGAVVFIRRSTITDDGILYLVVVLLSARSTASSSIMSPDQITRIDETARHLRSGGAVYPAVWLDGQRVTIHYYLGAASQVADSLLTAAFPAQWTSDHRLDGLAYAVIKANGTPLEDFAEVYKAGIPSYRAVAKLSKVWDPRESGQDPDDPSTWTWSDNAALVIMDYLWNADGMRLPRSMIELGIDAG
jgi:hypothetical protein